MNNLQDFKETLKLKQIPPGLSPYLRALWYDGKGDWQRGHDIIDHLGDRSSAHVHAYMHRKEGDLWNADYWYRRADLTRPNIPLEEEWEQLVTLFLYKLLFT